jgi:glycosyltransferase involved in cell wall biosynthesis
VQAIILALLMDVAIVAPCPIPYVVGGAENLWRGLQDHLNDHTPHQAEIIKLPSPERNFGEIVDGYRRFAALDLDGFDAVISSKYPAWMVRHRRHVVYLLHRLRGLYDAYPHFGKPEVYPDPPRPVAELRAFMAGHRGDRAALGELFERLDALQRAPALPADLFDFPGPLIREVVHHLDGVGLAPPAIARYAAISDVVRRRPDYFPDGVDVGIAHPPTGLGGLHEDGAGSYLFTASRLDAPKRIDLLVRAMAHVGGDVPLRIAGTGPAEAGLRDLAGDDRRITFCGRVSPAALAELYAGARAVAFVPHDEDYGYIALEAMLAGKPVVTCTDSGGTTELVRDGETGRVVEPVPEALGAAIEETWRKRTARRMGRAGRRRGEAVTWDRVVEALAL